MPARSGKLRGHGDVGVSDPEVCPPGHLLHTPLLLLLSETIEDGVWQELDTPPGSGQLTALGLQDKRCSLDWNSLKMAR